MYRRERWVPWLSICETFGGDEVGSGPAVMGVPRHFPGDCI